MSNREIARYFNQLAKLMEYHGENKFKIRSYSNAYLQLRKLGTPLVEMSTDELQNIDGVGKAISSKIEELLSTGELSTYLKYKNDTPAGIIELLSIRGIGPKKVRQIHDELKVESPGELLYACHENRLVELKGFGQKTQDDYKAKLKYYMQSRAKILLPVADEFVKKCQNYFKANHPEIPLSVVGQVANRRSIIDQIDFLVSEELSMDAWQSISDQIQTEDGQLRWNQIPIKIHISNKDLWYWNQVYHTSAEDLQKQLAKPFAAESQEMVFESSSIAYISTDLRQIDGILDVATDLDQLIKHDDIKGLIHMHTTYSDGIHSLEEMVQAAVERQFEYMLVTDHSKTAFYAGGLKVADLERQWSEIDELQAKYPGIQILKGIESDILNDGSLDYQDEILAQFDVIIASVHSQLKMDETTATRRLIRAIENPFTKILGHPTGRLLLSREGYPIDHELIIDACAANGIAIELNANPRRLDIDQRWLILAQEKGVLISINPDAHSISDIDLIQYGISAARQGLLNRANCLNALSWEKFEKWMNT